MPRSRWPSIITSSLSRLFSEVKVQGPEILELLACKEDPELPCCQHAAKVKELFDSEYWNYIADLEYPACGEDGYYWPVQCHGLIGCYYVDQFGEYEGPVDYDSEAEQEQDPDAKSFES